MGINPIKLFIYHHTVTAKTYNVIRNYRRDRRNKLSDEEFAQWMHIQHTGKSLDLTNPKTFDEKVWYLKLHDRNPLKTKCSDKLLVRDYVKECGLEHILNEVYGVYDSFKDIKFEELPDRFFMKWNHTSGANAIYDKNKPFDYKYVKNEFDFWMNRNYFWGSREYNYKNIVPKIICEKVLEDKNGALPVDYKFMCFGGKAKLLFLGTGLATEDGEHATDGYCDVFDMDFNWLPIVDEREHYTKKPIEKPQNWEKMIEYAEILSKPFRHCRVDFYNIDGKIYFGEITFHHGGGCNRIEPEEWALQMGQWIDIEGLE